MPAPVEVIVYSLRFDGDNKHHDFVTYEDYQALATHLAEAKLQLQVSDKVIVSLHTQLTEAQACDLATRRKVDDLRAQLAAAVTCTCSRNDMLPEECAAHGRMRRAR